MLNIVISLIFIRWIRSFFNDFRGRVQYFNVFSFSQFVTQDIPQAFVPAPLTLLFYINDLASTLNDDAVITLFPDDVSILTTAPKKEDAVAAVQ